MLHRWAFIHLCMGCSEAKYGSLMCSVKLRPKRRYRCIYGLMDAVREDMAVVEVTEEDAEDRTKWRWKIRCTPTLDRRIQRKKKSKKMCSVY